MSEPRIINTWDQLKAFGGDRIAICSQAAGRGREIRSSGFYVIRIVDGVEYQTDKHAAWYDRGHKFFPAYGRTDRREALRSAVAWVDEAFGARNFIRNRMGDYVEREVNAKYPIPRREKAEAKL